ncbi:HNH endonuclease [Melissococcus plutonius]|uniref:HNH endonuclease n=1 Tax=Melissococcus plutonius TaxID=33970 RepID=UPI003C304BFA
MPRVRRCRQQGCHNMVAYPDHYCTNHYIHEAEYAANRQRWARARDRSYTTKYNKINRNRSESKREQYAFYKSKQWSRLRVLALERDYYCCQYCRQLGVITQAKTVDHIIPIEFNPTLKADLDNLVDTCGSCHRLKTAWEQQYYGTGNGNNLKDVKPIKDLTTIVYLMQKISKNN